MCLCARLHDACFCPVCLCVCARACVSHLSCVFGSCSWCLKSGPDQIRLRNVHFYNNLEGSRSLSPPPGFETGLLALLIPLPLFFPPLISVRQLYMLGLTISPETWVWVVTSPPPPSAPNKHLVSANDIKIHHKMVIKGEWVLNKSKQEKAITIFYENW